MNWKDLEKHLSPDVLALSADAIASARSTVRTAIEREYRRLDQEANASRLEETFLLLWNEITDNEPLVREYKFHPTRKWRADFYHKGSNTLIEIEGGTRRGGRHNRADGYARDTEKYNAASALGYNIQRLTDVNLDYENVKKIANVAGLVAKGTK